MWYNLQVSETLSRAKQFLAGFSSMANIADFRFVKESHVACPFKESLNTQSAVLHELGPTYYEVVQFQGFESMKKKIRMQVLGSFQSGKSILAKIRWNPSTDVCIRGRMHLHPSVQAQG